MQLLSRYKTWLSASLPAREQSALNAPDPGASGSGNPLARSGTPLNNSDGADSSATDEANLQRFASAFIDISSMERKTWELWKTEIGLLLSTSEVSDDDSAVPEGLLVTSHAMLAEWLSLQRSYGDLLKT